MSKRLRPAAFAWLIVGLVIGLIASPASGQEEAAPSPDDRRIQVLNVVENDDGTVVLDVAIPGSIGELAPVQSNFGIAVNGTLVDQFDVAPLTTTLDVIIVIDTSGSMRGDALRDAKLAANAFIEQLPQGARIGVVGFGETVDVLSTPSTDREQAMADIDGLRAVGETALWDALVAAADVSGDGEGQPYVVVLSDGDDTKSAASRADAVARLQEAEAELYAIAIATPDGNGQTLREAADDVDGIFSATSGTEELEGLYQSIADRLASRYRLTFDPNRDTGGSVVVSVNANDAVATARTRLVGTEVADTAGNADRPARVLNVPADAQLGIVPTPDPGLLGQQMMLPLGIGAVFLALLVVGFLVVNPAMDVRLDAAAGADRLAGVNERMSGIADRLIARRDSEGELDKALDAAGLNLRPGEFTLMALVGVMFMTMAGWLIGGFGLSALFAMIASVGTLFYLNRRAEKRRKQFADQLTDTLGILIGSLRAGRGLPQAIELVSAEAPSPTSDQFRRILFETQVGRDMTESMMSVSERMKSPDFEWVARAVQINRELGGDLTEVLGNVAETIRDRRRIDRMVQALSAEGRASGWVLLALPFLMFGFLWWRTPDNVDLLLGTSLGRTLLAAALAGMVVGYFWIRRLVNIEY